MAPPIQTTPELRATIEDLASRGFTLYRIAKMLEVAGIPTPAGARRWQIKTVGRVLRRYR